MAGDDGPYQWISNGKKKKKFYKKLVVLLPFHIILKRRFTNTSMACTMNNDEFNKLNLHIAIFCIENGKVPFWSQIM